MPLNKAVEIVHKEIVHALHQWSSPVYLSDKCTHVERSTKTFLVKKAENFPNYTGRINYRSKLFRKPERRKPKVNKSTTNLVIKSML